MCFRPSSSGASEPIQCPNCGQTVFPMNGVVLPECPFCDADLTATEINPPSAPAMPTPPSVSTTGSPKPPVAPPGPGAPR